MESIISDLLASYEKGTVSRRDFVGGVAALALASTAGSAAPASAAPAPAAPPFKVMGLNHFYVNCVNLDRSVEFYQNVFGLPVAERDPERKVIKMGIGSHGEQIELHQAGYTRDGVYVGDKNPPGLDHIAFGVDNYTMKSVDGYFRSRGLVPRGLHGVPSGSEGGAHVLDPNGILIQLMQFPKA